MPWSRAIIFKPSRIISSLAAPYGSIGAICESSRWLARQMRDAITSDAMVPIIELGAGYGSVTRVLPETAISIEREPKRFEFLKRNFPGREIYDACAIKFLGALERPSVVISSIPSVNNHEFGNLRDAVERAQRAGKIVELITYTYFPHDPFAAIFLSSKMVKFEIRNIPPAFVWRYQS